MYSPKFTATRTTSGACRSRSSARGGGQRGVGESQPALLPSHTPPRLWRRLVVAHEALHVVDVLCAVRAAGRPRRCGDGRRRGCCEGRGAVTQAPRDACSCGCVGPRQRPWRRLCGIPGGPVEEVCKARVGRPVVRAVGRHAWGPGGREAGKGGVRRDFLPRTRATARVPQHPRPALSVPCSAQPPHLVPEESGLEWLNARSYQSW